MVHYRGSIPCDVLFIGEAPGESEDALGVPFIGPAGQLLSQVWTAAVLEAGYGHPSHERYHGPSFGITNIVACIPRNPSECGTGEIRTPHKDEAASCQPRLLEILEMANPRRIITLGDIAKRFFPSKLINTNKAMSLPRYNGQPISLIHPARILHMQEESPNQASLLEKKFVIALSTILKGLK